MPLDKCLIKLVKAIKDKSDSSSPTCITGMIPKWIDSLCKFCDSFEKSYANSSGFNYNDYSGAIQFCINHLLS